jgi:glycosyltransferase involved in cell wall biosynthesis
MKNSIIIPVYKNEDSIESLVLVLTELSGQLNNELEVVFVIDGSPDNSYLMLKDQLIDKPFDSQILQHSRNYGSFSAIRAGLMAASGEAFAVMAADLQEPPELVLEMFELLREENYDIVVGNRESRDDPFLSRVLSGVFWWLYRKLVIPEVPPGGVDMFGCNQQFRTELLKLDERNSSLIGLIYWLGFNRKTIGYSRRKRKHGSSAWTLSKKINYLMDSIFAFTDLPIKLLIFVGIFGLFSASFLVAVILIAKAFGAIEVPGYAATVLTILFFAAFNSLGLGIIGSYVWRAYGNTQNRPTGIVKYTEKLPGKLKGK